MANKYSIETVDFNTPEASYLGVVRDGTLSQPHPTWNYGSSSTMSCLFNGTSQEERPLLELQMPEKEDILGFGTLIKVELHINISASTGSDGVLMGIVKLDNEVWDEGSQNGAAGYCNWTNAQNGVTWSNAGAIKSKKGSIDSQETVFDTLLSQSGVPGMGFKTFDITPVADLGDKITLVIFPLDILGAVSATNSRGIGCFKESEVALVANRSFLRLTYRSYSPEGFKGKDDGLSIEPNPNNPEQPKLTWGAIEEDDFLQYKLYRDTSPITTVDGFKSAITGVNTGTKTFTVAGDVTDAFPAGSTFKVSGSTGNDGRYTVVSSSYSASTSIVVSETVPNATVDGSIHHGVFTSLDSGLEQFIDTFSHVDGTQYYYKLIAEDQDNHEDNALLSNPTSFTKPDITSSTITPTGNQNVGTQEKLTIVSPQNIKKLFVDWGDDLGSSGDVESWYEYETVGTSKDAYHIYPMQTGGVGVGIYSRVEDENGFWSSLTAAGISLKIDDTTPTAKLRVNVKKETLGDDITLDGSLSQPAGSNVTITKYEFKRDGADSWQNNGTNPVYTFDSGTYPNTVGSKTASLQITTSSGKTDTDTATYELETGTPTSLSFSKDTKIHELNHILGQNKITETPIGSAGVEYEFLISRKAERITLVATSNHPNTGTDIDIIRSAWINNTYVRITVSTEMESHTVQYDCKIDGDISLGHAYDNKQSWTFPIRVIARTEL